jgi:hypothetical protein
MNQEVQFRLAIAAIFTWIGFIGAISFMEAWLKFQAPGITLALGLGIGRLVFFALNKIEWILFILSSIPFFFSNNKLSNRFYWLISIPFIILINQTIWILPMLDKRAELVIAGQFSSPSIMHLIYISLEILKCLALITIGYSILKNNNHERIRINSIN